jgi:aminotransferase
MVISATTLSQRAAIAAFKYSRLPKIVKERVQEIQKRRDMTVKRFNEFPKIRCFKPKGCVNAFPNIKDWRMSSYDFAMRLMNESKVFVQPGTAFGKAGEGHVRISILHSFDEITEATDKIQQTLKKWESS